LFGALSTQNTNSAKFVASFFWASSSFIHDSYGLLQN
jgi:hypothetical protein